MIRRGPSACQRPDWRERSCNNKPLPDGQRLERNKGVGGCRRVSEYACGGRGSLVLESWLANDSQRSRLAAQLQSKHACLLSGAQPKQPMWLATIDVRTNTR